MDIAQITLTVAIPTLVVMGFWYGLRQLPASGVSDAESNRHLMIADPDPARRLAAMVQALSDGVDYYLAGDDTPIHKCWSARSLDRSVMVSMAIVSSGIMLTWLLTGNLAAISPIVGLTETGATARLWYLVALSAVIFGMIRISRKPVQSFGTGRMIMLGVVASIGLIILTATADLDRGNVTSFFIVSVLMVFSVSALWWGRNGKGAIGLATTPLVAAAGLFFLFVHPEHSIAMSFFWGVILVPVGRQARKGGNSTFPVIFVCLVAGNLGLTAWLEGGFATMPGMLVLFVAGIGAGYLLAKLQPQSREKKIALPMLLMAHAGLIGLVFQGLEQQIINDQPRVDAPWVVMLVLASLLAGLFLWLSLGIVRFTWQRRLAWQWVQVPAGLGLAILLMAMFHLTLLVVNDAGAAYGAAQALVQIDLLYTEFVSVAGVLRHWWLVAMLGLPLIPPLVWMVLAIFAVIFPTAMVTEQDHPPGRMILPLSVLISFGLATAMQGLLVHMVADLM